MGPNRGGKGINTHTLTHCLYNAKAENSISDLPQETEVLQMRVLTVATLLCVSASYTPPA